MLEGIKKLRVCSLCVLLITKENSIFSGFFHCVQTGNPEAHLIAFTSQEREKVI